MLTQHSGAPTGPTPPAESQAGPAPPSAKKVAEANLKPTSFSEAASVSPM